MKTKVHIIGAGCALMVLLAGCATDDPYAARGRMGSEPTDVQWGTDELPHMRGSTPGTHPSDPRGGTGADDFGGTDAGTRVPPPVEEPEPPPEEPQQPE